MGTTLTQNDLFSDVISPNPYEPIRASGEAGSAYQFRGIDVNGGIVYTALVQGVRIRQLGGISKALSVTVAGNDITVQLATNAAGAVTSTANAVVTAYNAVVAATLLATATVTGTGLGLAGIWEIYTPLTDDPFGSIRPPLQALTNRSYWLRHGIVDGERTIKKLYVDGTGTITSVAPNGEIWAQNAHQTAPTASEGNRLEAYRLKFRNVTAFGNPAGTTALNNEIRPINITKAWGFLEASGGVLTTRDSCSTTTAAISGLGIRVTLATPMTSIYYVPNVNLHYSPLTSPAIAKLNIKPNILSASQFEIIVYDSTTSMAVDPAATTLLVSYSVDGRQS